MKKVAIISAINTCHGTLLQAYATQKELEKLGLDSTIFNFRSNPIKQIYRVFNYSFLKTKLKEKGISILTKLKYKNIYNYIINREEKFSDFRRHKLKMTNRISSKNQLKDIVNDYDGVILGSDQVWNPQNLEMDYYTLNFVPTNIPKITLAPSFGVSSIPNNQIKKTKQYLSRIDYISVREKAGSKIIKELIGRDVPVVCDPTALLSADEWDEIATKERTIKDEYILCYFMSKNDYSREFSKTIAKKMNAKIISLPLMDEFIKSDLNFGDIKIYDADPSDFINLIKNSKLVLTDSFHCMMFSIYYKKDFFIFNRSKKDAKDSVNSRIDSISEILGIEDRRLNENSNIEDVFGKTVDWSTIHNNLNDLKDYTEKYLINALQNSKLL